MEHYRLGSEPQPRIRPGRGPLLSCVLALAFFLLAARLDLAERLGRLLMGKEHWQLDELALSLLLLALA
ncbi:MAG: hypothetical protein RSH52_29415, partial [Janthinobacterium sp.]